MKYDSLYISLIINGIVALSAVTLGFFLNQFARRGRIKIFQNSCPVTLQKKNESGEYIPLKEMNETPERMKVNLELDIFNSSSMDSKIVRDLYFVVDLKSENDLLEERLKLHSGCELINANLKPKEIQHYSGFVVFTEKINEIYASDWYIEYRNDKNRLKRILIKK